jgi:AcrR family transcriptional regulator
MARPKDQEERRLQLVEAAHAVAARKGIGAAQLRDVAEAAGLTPGAVLYYYDGLDELFFEAYERAVDRFCLERERVVAGIDDPAVALATALHLGAPPGGDDDEIRLLYEFEAFAFRSAPCAELMAGYVARQVEMYAAILEAGVTAGVFTLIADAAHVARNLVALEDGHGVYVLTGQIGPDAVEALLLEHAAAVTLAPLERLTVARAARRRAPRGR